MPAPTTEMSPAPSQLSRWHFVATMAPRPASPRHGVGSFAVYEAEWWHFDYKDWREYPILNVPFEKLDSGSGATLVLLMEKLQYFLEDCVLKNKWYVLSFVSVLFLCYSRSSSAAFSRTVRVISLSTHPEVISRPEFAHANFGIEFLFAGHRQSRLRPQCDKLFVPARPRKFLPKALFSRRLARTTASIPASTAPAQSTNTAPSRGLVLVASGDPNLSNRIQPDGTLAFVDEDHSYAAPLFPAILFWSSSNSRKMSQRKAFTRSKDAC